MTKFTRGERLAAARVAEAGESLAAVGRRKGMSVQVVRRSLRVYREWGTEGFFTRNTNFSPAQKLEVLEARRSQGWSYEEAAVKFGINAASTIWSWERRYLKNGVEGLKPKKKGRRSRVPKPKVTATPYEQLLAENEYLRAENEYLKKLQALVAEREAREQHDGQSG